MLDPQELEKLLLNELGAKLYVPGVKWKTYINPMRDDGVFIAEDKPIEPCAGMTVRGEPYYPPLPKTAHSLGYQLPHELANKLVEILNKDMPAYDFDMDRVAHDKAYVEHIAASHDRAEAEYIAAEPGALAAALEAAIRDYRYCPEALFKIMDRFLRLRDLVRAYHDQQGSDAA